MYKHSLLHETYKKLNLTFEFDDTQHMYIKKFDKNYFVYRMKITSENTSIVPIFEGVFTNKYENIIKKGLHDFEYWNIYEVLLWYYYYTIKYKHIEHKNSNRCYFSRIPKHYRNVNPVVGLSIIKNILDKIIIENKGVPKYYDKNILDNLITIK